MGARESALLTSFQVMPILLVGNPYWTGMFIQKDALQREVQSHTSVIGSIMPPKDVHVLISGTCVYVTLYGKGKLRL